MLVVCAPKTRQLISFYVVSMTNEFKFANLAITPRLTAHSILAAVPGLNGADIHCVGVADTPGCVVKLHTGALCRSSVHCHSQTRLQIQPSTRGSGTFSWLCLLRVYLGAFMWEHDMRSPGVHD